VADSRFDTITVAEAIEDHLFGIKLAKFPKFKDAINGLLKSELINHKKEDIDSDTSTGRRRRTLIYRDQLSKLHNAILLQAFFTPLKIKNIFSDRVERLNAADSIEILMINRHSVLGVGVLSQEMMGFLDCLRSELDLSTTKLPIPFVELPQLSLDGISNVMKELLAQSAAMTESDSMVLSYLDNDLEKAYLLACEVQSSNKLVNKYKQKIIQEYQASLEFEKTLDFFR
jgi:hypothetical protein